MSHDTTRAVCFIHMSGMSLVGKIACITGASRGIGEGIAKALAKEGCKLGICSRKEADIERCKREIEKMGADVFAMPVDVTSKEEVPFYFPCDALDAGLYRWSDEALWED